jgi:hypothetical protein
MRASFFVFLTLLLTAGCQTVATGPPKATLIAPGSQGMPDAPPNVNEWSLASKMLTRAGQLVRERGFQQGSLVPVASVCMATALERAFLEGDYSVVDFNYAREALARVLGGSRDPSPLADDPLDVPYWGRNLMDWNDTPGRTAAEAIQAFDAAARKAMELREAALQRPKR